MSLDRYKDLAKEPEGTRLPTSEAVKAVLDRPQHLVYSDGRQSGVLVIDGRPFWESNPEYHLHADQMVMDPLRYTEWVLDQARVDEFIDQALEDPKSLGVMSMIVSLGEIGFQKDDKVLRIVRDRIDQRFGDLCRKSVKNPQSTAGIIRSMIQFEFISWDTYKMESLRSFVMTEMRDAERNSRIDFFFAIAEALNKLDFSSDAALGGGKTSILGFIETNLALIGVKLPSQ